jgi:hypothetical protein
MAEDEWSPRIMHWIDVTAVVLLAAGTLAASWCTYQAELWSGVQAQKYTAAGVSGVYVRTTVVLGGVVFLAGVAQVLKLPRHRMVLTAVAAGLLLVGFYRIATLPLA